MAAPPFPFTAIAGQEQLKLALLLVVIEPSIGGVLIRGGTGTAKSTAVRGLAGLLPQIEVVRGCAFGCDPTAVDVCHSCLQRRSLGPLLERDSRRIPMVDLPVGSTPDRVLGAVDEERSRAEGRPALRPGLLAEANRGILYADEVNLLGSYLTAVLLDAAASGVNVLERDGLSVAHPARFTLIGTMNPEEGELRPQLADRFAITVEARTLQRASDRRQAVARRIAYDADPETFACRWRDQQEALLQRLTHGRELIASVGVPAAQFDAIVSACAAHGAHGLRPDIAAYRTARGHAALAGRDQVTAEDVETALGLALAHRRPVAQAG